MLVLWIEKTINISDLLRKGKNRVLVGIYSKSCEVTNRFFLYNYLIFCAITFSCVKITCNALQKCIESGMCVVKLVVSKV
ncbi:hypothetical protein DB91_04300 [Ehrlichia sp. Wisconsin_h]|nr:hypothetical protein DB91_04300 [Ehrlichia sp. Wisconsin_h]